MAKEPIDVLITDRCMPGMDGAELMRSVRTLYPATVRIVLSGQFGKNAGLRAVAVAHQFLPKPRDPGALKAAVQHSLAVRQIMTADAIRRAAGAVGALQFRPQTYAALLKILEQPDVPLEAVAEVIESDAAVTAKILQLVSSAFLGRSQSVGSILQAVQLLGLEDLKQAALSAEIMTSFQVPAKLRDLPIDAFFLHAQLAAQMAGRLPLPEPMAPKAVMAALLHDIGKLLVACQMPERFERVFHAVAAGRQSWLDAEMEQLGANHAEIGGYLLGLWGLPAPIVEGVLGHHLPLEPPATVWTIREAVRIANALANEADQRGRGLAVSPRPELARERLEALGCDHLLSSWREAASVAYARLEAGDKTA